MPYVKAHKQPVNFVAHEDGSIHPQEMPPGYVWVAPPGATQRELREFRNRQRNARKNKATKKKRKARKK